MPGSAGAGRGLNLRPGDDQSTSGVLRTRRPSSARGRTQARSTYVVVGIGAGVGVGVVTALLLDPKHGKERREAIKRKTSSLTKNAGKTVAGKAKFASDRARGMAIERGVIKPPADPTLEAQAAGALDIDTDTVADVTASVEAAVGAVEDAVTQG